MIRPAVRDGKPVAEIYGPATQRLLDLIVALDREYNEAPDAATAPDAVPQAVGGPDAS